MPAVTSNEMKGLFAAGYTGPQANGPVTRARIRAGLAQRAGSGGPGIGPQGPAGEGCGQGVVMRLRRQIGWRDAERGGNVDRRAAAEAVAAAGKPVVMAMLMERCPAVVVGMLLRAGLVVSAVEMKRGMGVAADEGQRQQHDQAAQE